MAPMIFFSFETVGCLTSLRGKLFESNQCDNTSTAAMCLSLYLVLVTSVSIARKVSGNEDFTTYEHLATLKLTMRERVQGLMLIVTALSTLFLFSVLGVKGESNISILIIGERRRVSVAKRHFFSRSSSYSLVRSSYLSQDREAAGLYL